MSAMSAYTAVPLDEFQSEFKDTSTEVSSVALGGRIVSFSDEFFAEADNLIKVEVRTGCVGCGMCGNVLICVGGVRGSPRFPLRGSLDLKARFTTAGRREDTMLRTTTGTSAPLPS